jgi:mono/diheme cytochrome c family protein
MLKMTAALSVAVLALVACPAEKTETPPPPATGTEQPAPGGAGGAGGAPGAPGGAAGAPGAPGGAAGAPGAPGAPAAGGTAAADPKAEAEQIFTTRCTVCHGATGKGDGPGAAALNPKPRNYSDAEWQKSVTDDYIAKVIVEGGAAVGKSPAMVANADLKDKPEVVKELVAKIRGFAGK